MKYAYFLAYKIKSININLYIWNQDRINTISSILKKISTYKPLFNYHDFKDLKDDHYLYELHEMENKKCIFCLKDSSQVSFIKKPHVIPYLLGNNYLLHYEECDECNEFFGKTLECELDKYLTPHRTLNKLKNRRGNLIKTELSKNRSFRFDQDKNIYTGELLEDELLFNKNSNHVTINLKQNKYSPMLVFKALMKIFYGLLPREHLYKFEKLREWIISRDNNFVLISPLSVVKTRLNGFSTSTLDIIILHKETTTIDEFKIELPEKEDFEFLAFLRFGHIVFEFPIFTDLFFKKIDFLQKNNLDNSFNLPYLPKPNFPANKEIIDFSESKKIVNTEPVYFTFNKVIKNEL